MQQSTRASYLIRCLGKEKEEKEVTFFFSLSFDAANNATATDVAQADTAKAPMKNGSKEEAADGTAGANGLFKAQGTENVQ